jgi:hypothetical protein
LPHCLLGQARRSSSTHASPKLVIDADALSQKLSCINDALGEALP